MSSAGLTGSLPLRQDATSEKRTINANRPTVRPRVNLSLVLFMGAPFIIPFIRIGQLYVRPFPPAMDYFSFLKEPGSPIALHGIVQASFEDIKGEIRTAYVLVIKNRTGPLCPKN